MNRRHPPYAKRLASITGPAWGTSPDGLHNTFWVLFGRSSWEKAKQWLNSTRRFVLLPPGGDPAVYDWRSLRNHPPVLLLPCGEINADETKALVAALLRDGAERVLYLGEQGITLYATPEGMRHAA